MTCDNCWRAIDDLPVTPERLESLGFVRESTDEYEGGPTPVWVCRNEHGEEVLTVDAVDTEAGPWTVYFGAIEDWNCWPQDVHLCGTVRAILNLLGVPT